MSRSKRIVLLAITMAATCAFGQTVGELAEQIRQKEAREAQEASAKANPVKLDIVKPQAQKPAAPRPKYQVHSVIQRNGTWFAEIARANLLSLASPGIQIEAAKVAAINSQGVSLTFPPDGKCLAKKARTKGAKAEKIVCPSLVKFVPVGDYF